jgi:hypothetical protein
VVKREKSCGLFQEVFHSWRGLREYFCSHANDGFKGFITTQDGFSIIVE